jgi:phosphoglycolate phosphatase-like HAD superfamily hydrolase
MKQNRLKKSVCLFDFDGTLVDSMGAFADLAAQLISKHYGREKTAAREAYLRTSGLPFFSQLEALFPNHPLNSGVARSFESGKQEGYWQAAFFPEVASTLKRLQETGIRTAISSNNGQELVDQFLRKRGATEYFDLVLGFRLGFSKGKDHFEAVLKHFRVGPDEVLFIGDSLHDAGKAKDFGLDFVGRVGTFSRERFQQEFPDLTVMDHFTGLGELLCR